jgi:periplasmic protein TonB
MGKPEAPPAPVAAAAPPPPPPAPPKKKHRKPTPQPVVQEVPVAAAATPPPAPATAPAPPAPVVLAAPPVDLAVYTSADTAVIPPVLVRPVLPKEPPRGVPEDQIGSVDLLVDDQGNVEAVRLASPGNRYQERMLVSAAKMWKFRPAYKDNHPVRYRTRVRLTV